MTADQLEFVDTNVMVYAFDTSAGDKHLRAAQLIEKLWESGAGCLSIQVLQEFYVTVTRKVAHPLAIEEARERIRELSVWRIMTPGVADVLDAISLQQEYRISFWDAMILVAAANLGCGVLWSEDLADGQVYRGIQVRNPFILKT